MSENIIFKVLKWINCQVIRPTVVGLCYGAGNILGVVTIRYFLLSKVVKWYNYPENFVQKVANC